MMNTRTRFVLTVFAAMAGFVLAGTSANATLSDNLVEYWDLDGNYDAFVDATHDGTQTGDGTFVGGKFGQAIDLESSDGTQSFITVGGDENDFDFNGSDMTVSLWYTTEDLYTQWQALIAKAEGGAVRLARNSNSGNLIKFDVVGPITDGHLNDPGWHHVVATVESGVEVTLWVDGALAATGGGGHVLPNTPTPLLIGGNPQSPTTRAWDGMIDDVAFWDRVLTDDEIGDIWNDGDGASIGSLTSVIPEPTTAALGLLGVAGLVMRRRKVA